MDGEQEPPRLGSALAALTGSPGLVWSDLLARRAAAISSSKIGRSKAGAFSWAVFAASRASAGDAATRAAHSIFNSFLALINELVGDGAESSEEIAAAAQEAFSLLDEAAAEDAAAASATLDATDARAITAARQRIRRVSEALTRLFGSRPSEAQLDKLRAQHSELQRWKDAGAAPSRSSATVSSAAGGSGAAAAPGAATASAAGKTAAFVFRPLFSGVTLGPHLDASLLDAAADPSFLDGAPSPVAPPVAGAPATAPRHAASSASAGHSDAADPDALFRALLSHAAVPGSGLGHAARHRPVSAIDLVLNASGSGDIGVVRHTHTHSHLRSATPGEPHGAAPPATAGADKAASAAAAAAAAASAAAVSAVLAIATGSSTADGTATSVATPVDDVWLFVRCLQLVAMQRTLSGAAGSSSGGGDAMGMGLDPEALGCAILEALHRYRTAAGPGAGAGGAGEEEARLQAALFELLGLSEGGLDLMTAILAHRRALVSLPLAEYKRTAAALLAAMSGALLDETTTGGGKGRGGPSIGPGVSVASESMIRAEKERRRNERRAARQAKALPGATERLVEELSVLAAAVDSGSGASGGGGSSSSAAKAAKGAAGGGAGKGGASGGAGSSGGAGLPGVLEALVAAGFSPDYLTLEAALGLGAAERDGLTGGAGGAGSSGTRGRGGPGGRGGLISVEEAIAAVGAGYGGETKRLLPEGTVETMHDGYKQFVVPPPKPAAAGALASSLAAGGAAGGPAGAPAGARLVAISELHAMCQTAFKGMSHLNRLQSELFHAAYGTGENLLVCAPTGAGKTNVAMLTVCQQVLANLGADGRVRRDDFKIIYVAPMKALAQEVVAKFSERLRGLGLSVRELTGDMQLTRREIAETQVIVTTPEKWDVITRKTGDGSLVSLVRLLILDEVHLLADERGAVIESIVARTLRLVESSQSAIRIVGLSATLPNYRDVASFLRVHPSRGLFYFNDGYRPVPLQQTFVGVNEANPLRRVNKMNSIAYEKALAAVRRGKQVMVFVHSRKDTVKTARALLDMARADGSVSLLSPFSGIEAEDADVAAARAATAKSGTGAAGGAGGGSGKGVIQGEGRVSLTEAQWAALQKEFDKSRNMELRELYRDGFGIHHAGMLRPDRALSERAFAAGVTKILVCTATLAWGVNLPAHTVIIKGTQIYDAEAGGFSDLGMLDVMQIFGRAGRPQFDTSGEGIIITGHERLPHYLGMLTQAVPIESSFIKALPDHLNAEIVSGTVTNIREAVAWLSYTYLHVRMMRNPISYGITWAEAQADPSLNRKRVELIVNAAKRLDSCHMARFDERSGNLSVTDLGRVASHYYIANGSIETFNHVMDTAPSMSDGDVLDLICRAEEFKNVKVRDEELAELDVLRHAAHVKIKGDVSNTPAKVNVLLQAYISGEPVRGFTLISDTAYVTQSAGRIARALFEIFLRKGWCTLAERLLTLSKCIDKRLWWDVSPLWQFRHISLLPDDVLMKLQACGTSLDELASMDAGDLGSLVRHPKLGGRVAGALRQLPYLDIEASVQPITRSVLRVTLKIWAAFDWNDRLMGGAVDPWWVWIEDDANEHLYHHEYILVPKKAAGADEPITLTFAIPIFEPLPSQYWVRATSDRWLGLETLVPVSFKHLVLPERHPAHTDLLDLTPLPVTALKNAHYEAFYTSRGYSHFNPVQTQIFHALYHSDVNLLLGAPTGSGKTVAAEVAVFRLLNAHPGAKAVYIAPLKALVSERLKDWTKKFADGPLKLKVVELTGDVTPDLRALKEASIIITTPEKWDGISRLWTRREYVRKVGLVVIDEIHLLGEERGPVLEVIVSRMRYIAAQTGAPIRFVGLSTALANARDLGDWLGIEGSVGLYNFRPSVRPVAMEVHIQGFPGKHYCPRMASMNKPAYAAITTYSPEKPVLIFVASRRQTRLTALELIALCATDENPRRFLHMEDAETEEALARVKDGSLKQTLAFGIGIHHAGLADSDRALVEELFVSCKIQVLVCTSTLAWGVNFPAHLVIVKGTEFFDAKTHRYVDFPITDVLQMMGRAGRPQFDSHGVAVILVHEPKKQFYRKFLYEPFPVESQLRGQLADHLGAEIAGGAIASRHDAVDYLTWTYLFRRLLHNPTYYGCEDTSDDGLRAFLYGLVDETVAALAASGCVLTGAAAAAELAATDPSAAAAAAGSAGWAGGSAGGTTARALPKAEDALAPTTLGRISSFYYLHHLTVRTFATALGAVLPPAASAGAVAGGSGAAGGGVAIVPGAAANGDVMELCRLMCEASEFAALPVRHNEDELNAGLAGDLPWAIGPADSFSSPHVKAFLLLQARMCRVPLPIVDYANDTKAVLDNAARVLNAMIDIAGEAGRLHAALRLMHIAQCVVMAAAPHEGTLWQLQGMTEAAAARLGVAAAAAAGGGAAAASAFGSAGIAADLGELGPLPDEPALAGLLGLSEDALRSALGGGGGRGGGAGSVAAATVELVLRHLRQLPRIAIECAVSQEADTPAAAIAAAAAAEAAASAGKEAAPVVRAEAGDVTLSLSLTNTGMPGGRAGAGGSGVAVTPFYNKRKEWGWWVVAADPARGELLALKRVSLAGAGVGRAVKAELSLPPPSAAAKGLQSMAIYLVSDTMRGLDQMHTVRFNVI